MRTDFILSAEIIVIALGTVKDAALVQQAVGALGSTTGTDTDPDDTPILFILLGELIPVGD